MSVTPTTLADNPLNTTTVVVHAAGHVRLVAQLVVLVALVTVREAAPLVVLAVAVEPVLVPVAVLVVVVARVVARAGVLVAVLAVALAMAALNVADKGREKWRLRLMMSAIDLLASNQQPCVQKPMSRRTWAVRTPTMPQQYAVLTSTGFVVTGLVAGPARRAVLAGVREVVLVPVVTVVRLAVLVDARVLVVPAVVVLVPVRALAVLAGVLVAVPDVLVLAPRVAAMVALASKERFHGILN